ncbi:MAG: hypothetical protein WDN48_09355 [Pseudolabrys sp.]
MAEIQSSDPSVWQARAAQARRIASMLLGPDAAMLETYARECDELGRSASAKMRPSSPSYRSVQIASRG